MRVLVTGGAGFIGSHLSEALITRGDEVWILDDLSTGRRANVASLQDSPRCHLVIDSILNRDLVHELVEKVVRLTESLRQGDPAAGAELDTGAMTWERKVESGEESLQGLEEN